MEKRLHEPVMLAEVISALHINTDGKYIDGTLGAGGHTIEILKRGGKVLGIDADDGMIEIAVSNIHSACPALNHDSNRVQGFNEGGEVMYKLAHDNFRNIKRIAQDLHFFPVNGVLLDLGISSKHLDSDDRGFSFKDPNAPLDMRLDTKSLSVTAAQLLNVLRHDQLNKMFELGMESHEARKWANAVTKQRQQKPFETVRDLVSIAPLRFSGINPATKAFMALRIAVNTEYENLVEGMNGAFDLLKKSGKLVVITFHSGEDRLVKEFIKTKVASGEGTAEGDQPLLPSAEEIERNPRSRSAKVRILTKNEIRKLSQKITDESSSSRGDGSYTA